MVQADAPRTEDKLVCMVGSDDFNEDLVKALPEARDWTLFRVLDKSEVQPDHRVADFDMLYDRARDIIDAAGRKPDAIIGHLDFPVTALVSLLCRDYGATGATPEAVAHCEHKYWMRQLQSQVLPGETPKVRAVNPFSPEAEREPPLPFPFWLKPVKAHSSMLGFRVREMSEYHRALHACRQAIHHYGEPFNAFLRHLSPDPDCDAGVDGNHALAEELISAEQQFTVEGFVHRGETVVYGAVESRRAGRHGSAMSSYHYPAELPEAAIEAAREVSATFLDRAGFDNAPFNAEFFRDPASGALRLLEINPRISKSHSPLFHMVDGATHHRQAIRLALGQRPDLPDRSGRHRVAAKFMMRSHEADGVVQRVPSQDEVDRLRRLMPELMVQVLVPEGCRLSQLPDQDSYSYEIMDIFLGGESDEMIEDAHDRCRDSLVFLIQPMPKSASR